MTAKVGSNVYRNVLSVKMNDPYRCLTVTHGLHVVVDGVVFFYVILQHVTCCRLPHSPS